MNWYARYAGDYMQDTAHLSLMEHGAYTMLLDHYYGSEKPLPDDKLAMFRICRAFAEDEQVAVITVAESYFPVGKDGLRHNKRADKEIAKRCAISKKRQKAGAKGADSKWHGKPMANAMANATTPTTTTTDTITTTKKSRGQKRFVPPTIAEVAEYCQSRNNSVSPSKFVNFYESKGWMVGKNKMKDWRAAVRNWEQSQNNDKEKGCKLDIFNPSTKEDMGW